MAVLHGYQHCRHASSGDRYRRRSGNGYRRRARQTARNEILVYPCRHVRGPKSRRSRIRGQYGYSRAFTRGIRDDLVLLKQQSGFDDPYQYEQQERERQPELNQFGSRF